MDTHLFIQKYPYMSVMECLSATLPQAAFDKAQADEFIRDMPDAYDQVRECLTLEASAKRALEVAQQATKQKLNEITQARVHLRRSGMEDKAPAADVSLFGQYLEVRGIQQSANNGWGHSGHEVNRTAEALGIEKMRLSDMIQVA